MINFSKDSDNALIVKITVLTLSSIVIGALIGVGLNHFLLDDGGVIPDQLVHNDVPTVEKVVSESVQTEVQSALAEEKGDKKGAPVLVDIGRVTVPILRPQKVTYMVVDLAVEIDNEDNAEKLEDSLTASRLG